MNDTPTPRTNAENTRLMGMWESWPRRHEGWLNHARQLERELAEVRKLLADESRDATAIAEDLFKVTTQRDALAEALRNCREDSVELLGERDWWKSEPRSDYQARYAETAKNIAVADAALQNAAPNPTP